MTLPTRARFAIADRRLGGTNRPVELGRGVEPPALETLMATAVSYGLEILGPPGIPA